MALTVDKLVNDDRFCGESVLRFLLYTPFGMLLLIFRSFLALVLWVASIILPDKSAVRQILSSLACWTFGVHVKLKGTRDPRCSILVANHVSCLDSLAASHVLGTISLKKWNLPPFFASTLGIRNASQFVRKQHFAECPSQPVLLQPEGGPTNGKGLLQFTDWPFPLGNRVQPVAISVERLFTRVTVRGEAAWAVALWHAWGPATAYVVRALPPLERRGASHAAFVASIRAAIAHALQIEQTDFKWEQLCQVHRPIRRREVPPNITRLAAQVKEVLPRVPLKDIIRDLASTRSVDVTITNFLEGVTPYTPEPETPAEPRPSTSQATPRYVTPQPTGVFPKSARERQLSFQEKKTQMIAEARKRYIEKHGLNLALNNC